MSYGTLISTVSVGAGGATSIDFTSIPQTYTDLVLVCSGRLNGTGFDLQVKLNGSTTGYTTRYLDGSGTAASSGTNTNTQGYAGKIEPSSYTTNTFGNLQIYIPNYAGSATKVWSSDSVIENNASAGYDSILAGISSITAGITSISLADWSNTASFVQYSTASLYGVR